MNFNYEINRAGYGWSMDNNRDFPRPFHGGLNPSSFIPPYEPSYQYRRRQRYNKTHSHSETKKKYSYQK